MTIVTKALQKSIVEKLKEIELKYQKSQGIILSEYDLQCLLFREIYGLFNHEMETHNHGIKGSPLHAEIKFFDANGKLTYRPDLTIIEPKYYSILHSVSNFYFKDNTIKYRSAPTKEFEFTGDAIIIELKFCKNKTGIGSIKAIEDDLKKILEIQRLLKQKGNKLYGILAIFNKTDKKSDAFNYFLATEKHDDIAVEYFTGRVAVLLLLVGCNMVSSNTAIIFSFSLNSANKAFQT